MSSTILTPEQFCREIAAKFPTPNTLRAIALAESGELTWEQVATVFGKAIKDMAVSK